MRPFYLSTRCLHRPRACAVPSKRARGRPAGCPPVASRMRPPCRPAAAPRAPPYGDHASRRGHGRRGSGRPLRRVWYGATHAPPTAAPKFNNRAPPTPASNRRSPPRGLRATAVPKSATAAAAAANAPAVGHVAHSGGGASRRAARTTPQPPWGGPAALAGARALPVPIFRHRGRRVCRRWCGAGAAGTCHWWTCGRVVTSSIC